LAKQFYGITFRAILMRNRRRPIRDTIAVNIEWMWWIFPTDDSDDWWHSAVRLVRERHDQQISKCPWLLHSSVLIGCSRTE